MPLEKLLVEMGLPLVCGAICVVIWTCFKVVEKDNLYKFKRELATAIRTSTIFTIGTKLPGFWIYVFDAVFTDKLLSIRGFIRSCMASITIVAILFVFWYSTIPAEWHLRIANLAEPSVPNAAPTWFLIAVQGYGIDIGLRGEVIVNQREALGHMNIIRLYPFVYLPFLYNFLADFLGLILTRRALAYLLTRPTKTIGGLIITFLASACLLLDST
jgi:hypothetical protein